MPKLQHLTKSISNKFKLLEDVLNLKPLDMAKICDCSQATYYRYRDGKSIPGWDCLINLINYDKRINPDWLLKGTGPVLNTDRATPTSEGETIKLPLFNMYEDKATGEGSLSISDWRSNNEEIWICLDIFKFVTIESFDNLIVVKVQCDAMYPDIKPGSIAIVDKQQNNISLDSIYLMQMDGNIRMKIVQKAPNNKVLLSTFNNKYPPIHIPLDEIGDSIIGRIVWVGTPYN